MLLLAFGIALFYLWRAAAPSQRWLQWIVAAGFLARAIAGLALFWISWLHLPVLRSLQMGDGFWIFAQDGAFYFPQAVAAAEKGWRAIVFYDRASASVSYVQILSGMISLLGRAPCVALLLNLFCYLGTIALLVRWSRAQPSASTAIAVAIAAISLTPSVILWSLQPMKESLFQLLFVAFVAACAAWQRRRRAATVALMAVLLFLLAGIRWYFAGALLAVASLFLLVVAFKGTERKLLSLGVAAMTIVVLTLSTLASARASFRLITVDDVRLGFDRSPAGTRIKSGASTPSQPSARQFTAADAARVRAALDAEVAEWNRQHAGRGRVTGVQLAGAGDTASLSGRWEVLTPAGTEQTSAFTLTMRRSPNGEWKIVHEGVPAPRARLRLERLLVGAATLVIPRALGEPLGLFAIGGGRGLLWFADVDTLIFDAALIVALWALYTARAAVPWRFPLTWLVLLTTLIVALPLVYSVSNFGTLFRLREMTYLGMLLLPIAAAAESRRYTPA